MLVVIFQYYLALNDDYIKKYLITELYNPSISIMKLSLQYLINTLKNQKF